MKLPDYQWPALVLAVLSLSSIFLPGLAFGPHAGETEYHHRFRPPSEATECQPELNYSELSPRAREVLDEAMAEGGTTLYGEGVDEFEYPGFERRFVRHDVRVRGECVHLYTEVEQNWGEGLAILFGRALGVFGILVAGLAALLRRPRVTILGYAVVPTMPLSFLFGWAVLVVPVVIGASLWVAFGRVGLVGKEPELGE